MPGKDRIIDPVTGAYVENADGSEYQLTEDIRTQVYHQVNTPFNTWVGDPGAGRKQTVSNTSAQELSDIRQSYLAALQLLVDSGAAANPEVRVFTDDDVPGRVQVRSKIDDRQFGAIDTSKLTRFKE